MSITRKRRNKRSKIPIGIAASICTLLAIYFGMAAYFTNHFYFGSQINCVNVSGKTVEEANAQMASKLQTYTLNLKERDGKSEQIKGSDISLNYNSGGEYKKFKDNQNPFKWVVAIFNKKDSQMTDGVTYDKQQLEEKIEKLSCLESKNIIEPKNPSFKYTDKGYITVDEVNGNKIDKNALHDSIIKAISNGEDTIDLETANCYINPKYTLKSPKVTETKNALDKCISSKITYNSGDVKATIDGSTINKWLEVDGNLDVKFNKEKMKASMGTIFSKFSTVGKTRSFATSSGKTIQISSGDYGWLVDTDKELQALSTVIKEGQTVTKEPTYAQTAANHNSNDIGNTYVEIDMSKQHLWFYKKGSLVVQGDVVTGNVSNDHSTPEGIYALKYKERNATLKGQDYNSPVDYWMPFNGGVGIHDASWRDEFGGKIYMTNGSHGCVNSPHYLAQTIYENIDPGTPIICYY
ncbi:peptidoglycan binding domain-containing protein [Clostridium thailandense]|uniref:L,D-transpeptidase family protein n=1 Tax=Clostridium thailandense TaxID=2794346 RepID=UPI0039894A2E